MTPQELKDLADVKFDRSVFLKNLRETAHSKLTVIYNGGSFTANRELISFLNSCSEENIHVEDDYNNPILVHRRALLDLAMKTYTETMLWWSTEVNRGNRIRRAANV